MTIDVITMHVRKNVHWNDTYSGTGVFWNLTLPGISK